MAIYAISDLHLALGMDKPMDVFGDKWENFTENLQKNWQEKVNASDVVIIPGDISWATYLENAFEDFNYINNLNGKKIILKGNHDYWWTTMNKLNKYVRENNFDTIEFIHNTAIMVNDTAICGTRGWSIVTEKSSLEDKRFFEREKVRLVLSLEDAKKKNPKEIIVAMHYPPVERNNNNEDFLDIMREYGVKRCFYGHLHAAAHKYAKMGNISGINLSLVSCDYLNFEPLLI